MKIKILGITLGLIALLSCSEKAENKVELQEVQNETPQVLDQNTDYKLSSISKRYSSDIISKLYNEALEKSSKLNQLNDEINGVLETKNDSLLNYSKFSQTNTNYWTTANSYVNQIQDSVLKESTLEVIKVLESTYKNKMSIYEQKLIEIDKKTISLNDQLILMKLVVTEPMMKNYQRNEKPNIKSLEMIISEYDRLIKETEEYTNFEK